MIRLTLTDSSNREQVLAFPDDIVTIGRSPDNLVCLNDLRISKNHGRICHTKEGFFYEDQNSTNGSILVHNGKKVAITGSQVRRYPIVSGDVIVLAPYSLKLDLEEPLLKDAEDHVTVVLSQPIVDLAKIQADLFGADSRAADLILRLIRETGPVIKDEDKLLSTISDFVFQALPMATHQVIVVRDLDHGRLTPMIARSRNEGDPEVALSSTIVNTVLEEETCLLFSHVQTRLKGIQSIMESQIETAICAPLHCGSKTFGALQVDIRPPGKGMFTKRDVDLVAVLASYMSLVLDNLRLYQQQRRAMESTISALVHSLSLKDSDTAEHSERVKQVSLLIGNELELNYEELEILSSASILHDMGKHAVRDDVLHKPARLTDDEYQEISQHASHTQTILDKIYYPEHLRSIPLVAAYHHEKMNGSGTYGIKGEEIPIQARIIAVADAFDALASARSYKEPMPLPEILALLNKNRGEQWDGKVLDALEQTAPVIIMMVYGRDSFLARTSGIQGLTDGDDEKAA
jgi:response regulator RpfG family c-di-GMP phosphodiesterase/pSer/pThr/pTyr-binding forkhead associated (FHA) protein